MFMVTLESKLHKPCRTVEDGLYNQNVACKTERHALKEIKELKCRTYSEVAKKLSDQAANNAIVTWQRLTFRDGA